MKSARRKAFIAKKNNKTEHKFFLIKLLIPVIFLVALFLFVKISTAFWDGKNKVVVSFCREDGDVGVTVMDPVLSEITTIIIPGNTQVDVAGNYGTMLIGNVRQLGVNEKIGGRLLSETITQNFLFPVFLWADTNAQGLGNGDFPLILRFMFIPKQTNISFGDRIAMGIFAIKIQSFGKTSVDMGNSHFLDKKKLEDGSLGYTISGPISARLTMYFSDNEMSGQDIKVHINDATGVSGVSEKVGEILQIVGGKVVSVDKKTVSDDSDCTIIGTRSDLVSKISALFSCKKGTGASNFDLDIHLGTKFAKRF